MDETKAYAEEMLGRFHGLVNEVNLLKPIIETIVCMRTGLRYYQDCKRLNDSLKESQTLAERCLMEIDVELKALEKEGKAIIAFTTEPPHGVVQ